MKKPTDPASDALRQRAQITGAWRAIERTPEGKRVIADLMRATGVLAETHVPGDSHESAHRAGARSIGLHVIDRLRWTETDLLRLAQARADDVFTQASED